MAALLKRPVLLMLGIYLGGNRYRLVFEEIYDFSAWPVEPPGGSRGSDAALRERLEHYSRAYPFNWFNFFDFWEGAATRPRRRHGATGMRRSPARDRGANA